MRGQLCATSPPWSHRERVSWVTWSWSLRGLETVGMWGGGLLRGNLAKARGEGMTEPGLLSFAGTEETWGKEMGRPGLSFHQGEFYASGICAYILSCRQQRSSLSRDSEGVEAGGCRV